MVIHATRADDYLQGDMVLSAPTNGNLSIAYQEIGDGEPVVLIQGLGGTMHEWNQTFINQLSDEYSLFIFDNTGGLATQQEKHWTVPYLQ